MSPPFYQEIYTIVSGMVSHNKVNFEKSGMIVFFWKLQFKFFYVVLGGKPSILAKLTISPKNLWSSFCN